MRLFIAIPLAQGVVRQLSALCGRLRSDRDGLRWSAPESWHITLQFLGSTDPGQFECVKAHLAEVHAGPVPVRLGGLGVFERTGVFHVEAELTPELLALQKQVVAATSACGFIPEERPYHPHITLARAKGEGNRKALKDLKARVHGQPAFSAFVAREFLLYESHLGPGGSKYEIKAKFGSTESAGQ